MSTSILDEQGDVHLFTAGDGTRWIFREDVCHGLELNGVDNYSHLYRQGENFPAVRIASEGSGWVARWQPSNAVAARWDTRYGLIAKMARRLLKPAACCRGDAL